MIEINLAPDVKQELIKAQRIRNKVIVISVIVGVISIVVVVLLAINVFAVQAVRNNIADGSIKDKGNSLNNMADLPKTLTIQNQLNKISDIYDNKKIDSRLFDVLVRIIPPAPNDVKISSLNIDSGTETITIDGQAANSYVAFEIFKKTIEGTSVNYTDSDGIKNTIPLIVSALDIGSTSYGQDATTGAMVLRFSISFKYSSELFAVTSKDLSVTVTASGNVTDSYLGVPTSIFTVKANDIQTGGTQ
jgi:hypothetical protein